MQPYQISLFCLLPSMQSPTNKTVVKVVKAKYKSSSKNFVQIPHNSGGSQHLVRGFAAENRTSSTAPTCTSSRLILISPQGPASVRCHQCQADVIKRTTYIKSKPTHTTPDRSHLPPFWLLRCRSSRTRGVKRFLEVQLSRPLPPARQKHSTRGS